MRKSESRAGSGLMLSEWQEGQARLLYRFSSFDYLCGLRARLRALRAFSGETLDKSHAEGRDEKLGSKQWGNRNTGANWGANAGSFLIDFEQAIAQSIIDRSANIYHRTGAYQCARGISEFSMQWMAPEEQARFDRLFEALYRYAHYIDETMDRTTPATRWNDFGLTMAWKSHLDQFRASPQLRVHVDIFADSGQLPPKTGVYVSADDPDATLQFAWTGSPAGKLLDATTFNVIGKAALTALGRTDLWIEGDAMLRFSSKTALTQS